MTSRHEKESRVCTDTPTQTLIPFRPTPATSPCRSPSPYYISTGSYHGPKPPISKLYHSHYSPPYPHSIPLLPPLKTHHPKSPQRSSPIPTPKPHPSPPVPTARPPFLPSPPPHSLPPSLSCFPSPLHPSPSSPPHPLSTSQSPNWSPRLLPSKACTDVLLHAERSSMRGGVM